MGKKLRDGKPPAMADLMDQIIFGILCAALVLFIIAGAAIISRIR